MASFAATECAVCFDEVEAVNVVRTRCAHLFCSSCLTLTLEKMGWSQSNGNCPTCRGEISKYNTVYVSDGRPLAAPEHSTIFRSSYASYIFKNNCHEVKTEYVFGESVDDCHLRYRENLDAPFTTDPIEDASFDKETRVFNGHIGKEITISIEFSESFFYVVKLKEMKVDKDGDWYQSSPDIPAYGFPPHELFFFTRQPAAGMVSVEGCVYTQGAVGVASYHFGKLGKEERIGDWLEVDEFGGDEERAIAAFNEEMESREEWECYLDYSQAPEIWGNLGNGDSIPQKKYFTVGTMSFVPKTRTFKGHIDWTDVSGFNGNFRWEYAFKFSSNFIGIESGTCTAIDEQGVVKEITRFGPVYGQGLTYRWFDKGKAEIEDMRANEE